MGKYILRNLHDLRKEITKEDFIALKKEGKYKDMALVENVNDFEVWERQDAIRFYLEGMYACEGAEKEDYTNIYLDLIGGKKICRADYDIF